MKSNGTSKKFVSNSGWMMAQQIYNMLLSLIVGSLSARYLGPANYGLLSYGASILSFFTIVSKLGLDSVLINEMLKEPKKQGSYLGSALVARLIVSILSLGCIMAIVRVLEPDNKVLHLVTLLQSFAIIFQTYEVLRYWFQMKLKMKYVSIAAMLAMTVVGAWRILLLVTDASVYFFALSNSIQALVCGAIVVWIFSRQKDINLALSVKMDDAKNLLKKSYHFIISGLAVTLYTQIDKIMIGKMINAEAVGIYAAATAIAVLWEFVPNALISSACPLIIEHRENDYSGYVKRFQMLLLGITLLSVIVGIGVMIFGGLAVNILYGESYSAAVFPLSILIWSTGFAMIGSARSIWFVAEGYNKYTKYCTFLGAVVNCVLNIIAIQLWGIVGAAIATLVSQIVVALVAPMFFKEIRKFVKIYFGSFCQLRYLWKLIQKTLSSKNINES